MKNKEMKYRAILRVCDVCVFIVVYDYGERVKRENEEIFREKIHNLWRYTLLALIRFFIFPFISLQIFKIASFSAILVIL